MKSKKKETPLTGELRVRLKALVERELARLPELLEGLEGRERPDATVKLIPFVLPKVQSVPSTRGEPLTFD